MNNSVVKFWQNKVQYSKDAQALLTSGKPRALQRGLHTCPFKMTQSCCQPEGTMMLFANQVSVLTYINLISCITDTGMTQTKSAVVFFQSNCLYTNDSGQFGINREFWNYLNFVTTQNNDHGKDKTFSEHFNPSLLIVSTQTNDTLTALAVTDGHLMDTMSIGGDSGGTQVSPRASPNEQSLSCPRLVSRNKKNVSLSSVIMLVLNLDYDP